MRESAVIGRHTRARANSIGTLSHNCTRIQSHLHAYTRKIIANCHSQIVQQTMRTTNANGCGFMYLMQSRLSVLCIHLAQRRRRRRRRVDAVLVLVLRKHIYIETYTRVSCRCAVSGTLLAMVRERVCIYVGSLCRAQTSFVCATRARGTKTYAYASVAIRDKRAPHRRTMGACTGAI